MTRSLLPSLNPRHLYQLGVRNPIQMFMKKRKELVLLSPSNRMDPFSHWSVFQTTLILIQDFPHHFKASSEAEVKGKKKNSNKKWKNTYEPEVVFSDVHPVYVKTTRRIQTIIYPNSRLDGVRGTENFPMTFQSSLLPHLLFLRSSRGLSSWSLGDHKPSIEETTGNLSIRWSPSSEQWRRVEFKVQSQRPSSPFIPG